MDGFDLRPARDHGLSPLDRLRSPRRESGLGMAAAQAVWAVGGRLYFHLWHRLRVVGAERLPAEPPFVICANHASHLDALALAAPLPLGLRDRVYALAAGDVFFEQTAAIVFAAACVSALPVWRRKAAPRALRELREKLLTEPAGFILFPEGARSRDGTLLRFRAGVGAGRRDGRPGGAVPSRRNARGASAGVEDTAAGAGHGPGR